MNLHAIKNKIRWRARRGNLELDLIFTRYLESRGDEMNQAEMPPLLKLLDKDDDELIALLILQTREPEAELAETVGQLRGIKIPSNRAAD